MRLHPTIRLRFAWLALCAVLLGAFAPSLSYAMSSSRPVLPIDVCATHGGPAFAAAVALLAQDDDERGARGDAVHHCGNCLAHHGHGMPDAAPPPAIRLPASALRHARPAIVAISLHAPAPRAHAQPRGPPAAT